MKKIIKALSVLVAPLIMMCAFFAGCKSCKGKHVDVVVSGNVDGGSEYPTQTPMYEAQSRQLLQEYMDVANNHLSDGDIDIEDPAVVEAAKAVAGKLYAYACYNERYLEHYVYFSDKDGYTDLGSNGSGELVTQDFYLRVNENLETGVKGARFHRTIKKVNRAKGSIKTFKGLLENGRIRITKDTNLLYRFEVDDKDSIHYGEDGTTLECEWKTGEDWGKPDAEMVKGAYLPTEADILADIQNEAGGENPTIHGNINTLAENIVKYAYIVPDPETSSYLILIKIDTEVANNDSASLKMLRHSNGNDDCKWVADNSDGATGLEEDTGLQIVFQIWDNGLFRMYNITERWKGTVKIYKGTANVTTITTYSYSDADCDPAQYFVMLDEAEKVR